MSAISKPMEQQATELATLTERLRVAEAALDWYAEQAAGCRKLGRIGDPARQALDADGGERARAALALIRGEG